MDQAIENKGEMGRLNTHGPDAAGERNRVEIVLDGYTAGFGVRHIYGARYVLFGNSPDQAAGAAHRHIELFLELVGDDKIVRQVDNLNGDKDVHIDFVFPDHKIPEENGKQKRQKLQYPVLGPGPAFRNRIFP